MPHRIAVIAGDGIGKETRPEGIRVMQAAAKKFNIPLQFDHFDFASWDYYEKHGKMMPDDWKAQIGGHDAIYFGAVGWPEKIADHVSLWGSLILFRREFDQYVNLRPARLMPGVIAPVVKKDGSPYKAGEIDFYIVRENTEGEYSSVGGRMFPGTDREFVLQESVFTRTGVDRILKFAFDLAQSRPKKHLTSATKSNGISISMPYWDERVAEMAKNYPGLTQDKFHIDILSAHFVQRPVHGSAPDIAGKGIANPIGQIWCGAMMLEWLGYKAAHDAVLAACEASTASSVKTGDLGGTASTKDVGRFIAEAIAAG